MDKRKKLSFLTLLAMLLATLCACQAVAAPPEQDVVDAARERVEVAKMNQSIAIAVIDENGTRFTNFGRSNTTQDAKNADENTVFEIASITKVFTGVLLAEAIKRGEVELDDPVSKHLPNTVIMPSRDGREITLLDLATHTSGLPAVPTNFEPSDPDNPWADYTVEQMYEFLSGYTLTRDIGVEFEYANIGTGLLGHVLALRAGTSYKELVKDRILNPLGMNDTSITLSPDMESRTAQGFTADGVPTPLWDVPALPGTGALRSTTNDMAKFIAANMGLTTTDLAGSFEMSHKTQRDAGEKMEVGLSWLIWPSTTGDVIWHDGGTGGFRSFAGFSPSLKRGVVILTNSAVPVDDLGLRSFDPEFPLTEARREVAVSEEVLDEYVGNYQLAPDVVIAITREADRLSLQITDQPAHRLFAEGESEFFLRAVDAQVTFNRGADGKIESLTLHQGGDQIAPRIE